MDQKTLRTKIGELKASQPGIGYRRISKALGVTTEAARYRRICMGDAIKRQLDPLIRQHFGFSAFTEDREQKRRIRRTLEAWGEDNYDQIIDLMFAGVQAPAVNPRLVRTREAKRWRDRGGIIVEICRDNNPPATTWENDRLCEPRAADYLNATIFNDGTIADLERKVRRLLLEQRDDTTK